MYVFLSFYNDRSIIDLKKKINTQFRYQIIVIISRLCSNRVGPNVYSRTWIWPAATDTQRQSRDLLKCIYLLINLRSPRDYVGPPFVRSFALSPLDGASVREAHCEQASTAVRRTEAPCAQASTAVRFSARSALRTGYCSTVSDI